jgi:hypothetical protein
MNKYDLQLLFEDKVGGLMTDTTKVFETNDIERFLNNAMDVYFEKLAEVFEVDENARRALSELTLSSSIISASGPPSGVEPLSALSIFFEIELSTGAVSNMYKVVEGYIIDSLGNKILTKPVKHDQYHANINNPFKQPYEDMVWRLDIDGVVEIVPIGITPVSYVYRYLKRPDYVDFTTESIASLELRNVDLKKIVDIAVGMAVNSLSIVKSKE